MNEEKKFHFEVLHTQRDFGHKPGLRPSTASQTTKTGSRAERRFLDSQTAELFPRKIKLAKKTTENRESGADYWE